MSEKELAPHQQRVLDEKTELDKKSHALSQFIGHSPIFEALDADGQERLKKQNDIMWQYSEILGKRIEAFLRVSFEKQSGEQNILADFRRNSDGAYYNQNAEREWKDFVALNVNCCDLTGSM